MPRNSSGRSASSSGRRSSGRTSSSSSSSGRSSSGRSSSGRSRSASETQRGAQGRFKKTITKSPRERIDSGERVPAYIKNTGKEWSDKDVKQLREFSKMNTPTRVIGLKLGRSESSIRGKVRSLGISLKPSNRSPR